MFPVYKMTLGWNKPRFPMIEKDGTDSWPL